MTARPVTARARAAPDQLALPLDAPVGARDDVWTHPWSAQMLPGVGDGPFDDDAWFFEPWWPGIPATVVVDGTHVSLRTAQLGDPLPAFPELALMPQQVAARQAVIAGTLLVLDADGRPDAEALRMRLADPEARRGSGAFIAADLVSWEHGPLVGHPFATRRGRLLEVVADGDRFLVSRGLRGEGETLAAAAAAMGIEGISARRLDATWRPGVAADAWLRLPVAPAAVGPVRPLLVLLQRLPLD